MLAIRALSNAVREPVSQYGGQDCQHSYRSSLQSVESAAKSDRNQPNHSFSPSYQQKVGSLNKHGRL